MARRKETELTKPVSITIRPSLARRATAAAKERGLTRSKYITFLLTQALDGKDGRQDGGQKG